jgi:coatomer protein complex subunit alpha (xenin)
VVSTVSEYVVALSVELARRALPATPANQKRNLELSAYFTIPKLEVAHRQIALMSAMNNAFRAKNYSSALSFASRIIANGGQAAMLDKARKMKAQVERNPVDNVEIEYDQFAEFEICANTFTPIYANDKFFTCPYDGAKYHEKLKGTVCKVCEVCEVGASAAGWRLIA